jgi:hypothetical protein
VASSFSSFLLLLLFFFSSSSSSSSALGPSANAPEAPQPKAYCANLNINQPILNNPVFLVKKHRSLTVAVLKSCSS